MGTGVGGDMTYLTYSIPLSRTMDMNLLDEASPGNARICADRNIYSGTSL